ncbi:MAG TPA: hypothetical protein DEF82_05020 [Crocinitomicaceae bacterium]|jgi:hypothetical protein|nr:hypothetical protein [Crocinitomicaceae bacterium]
MFLDAEAQTAYEFANAQIREFPFPHFYLKDIFPTDFYQRIQNNLPSKSELWPIEEKRPVKGYKERFVCCFDDESLSTLSSDKSIFWKEFRDTYLRGAFGSLLMSKFHELISARFDGRTDLEFYDELLLVHDIKNYSLGPHTDSPKKVITVLFYLPADENHQSLGTSVYIPNDSSFQCPGGPHHPHENFLKLKTMPYSPNSVFCFFKTNNSFHGVEKLTEDGYGRWLLLYDIYVKNPQATSIIPSEADVKNGSVKFTF